MKLQENTQGGDYRIQAFSEGQLTVNGLTYTQSIILLPNHLQPWRPQVFQDIVLSDVDALLALKPDVILLGTGMMQQFIPDDWPVTVECMSTAAACRTFTVLSSEDRYVLAALLLR